MSAGPHSSLGNIIQTILLNGGEGGEQAQALLLQEGAEEGARLGDCVAGPVSFLVTGGLATGLCVAHVTSVWWFHLRGCFYTIYVPSSLPSPRLEDNPESVRGSKAGRQRPCQALSAAGSAREGVCWPTSLPLDRRTRTAWSVDWLAF